MPDLDQLLTDDARHDELTPPTVALDDALHRARSSTQRRHALTAGATLAAAGVLGAGLLYATTGPGSPERGQVRLAAYDKVIGPDPSRSDHVIVVGPADEHVADCERVPADIDLTYGDDGRVTGFRAVIAVKYTGGFGAGPVTFGARGIQNLPPGPYYAFSCHSDH